VPSGPWDAVGSAMDRAHVSPKVRSLDRPPNNTTVRLPTWRRGEAEGSDWKATKSAKRIHWVI